MIKKHDEENFQVECFQPGVSYQRLETLNIAYLRLRSKDPYEAWIKKSLIDQSLLQKSMSLGMVIGSVVGALIGAGLGALTMTLNGTLVGLVFGLVLGGVTGAPTAALTVRTAGRTGGIGVGYFTGMLLGGILGTTIGALLSAIGIAGMDRLVQRNVLALSGRAVEAAGDCDVLLLDKTGTITLGNRQARDFVPAPGVDDRELAEVAQLASLSDETPEGRSIVVLAKDRYGLRGRNMHGATLVPFSGGPPSGGRSLSDGHQTVTTTLPRAWPPWRKRMAAAVSSSR